MTSNEYELRDLVQRIEAFVAGELPARDFCKFFENAWSFGVAQELIPRRQRAVLDHLFDEVVYFSPLPREEWGYPEYRDAQQIMSAAQNALLQIKSTG